MTDARLLFENWIHNADALSNGIALLVLVGLILIYRRVALLQAQKGTVIDERTGLWKSTHLIPILNAEIDRARPFDHSLAVLVVDVDHLGEISQTLGQQAADSVLVSISNLIRATCRSYDVAGMLDNGRFCIILPEIGWTDALAAAEKVRAEVAGICLSVKADAEPICPTLSIGVAYFPRDADTAVGLINNAESALTQARLNGCNTVVATAGGPGQNADASASERAMSAASRTDRRAAEVAALRTRIGSDKKPGQSGQMPPLLALVLVFVITAGVAVTLVGFALNPSPDWFVVGLVGVLAALTQLPRFKNIYQGSSVSVSVAVNFAAALLGGVPAVVVSSAAIALAHWVQRRPAAYKTMFNWATHVLAGSLPAFVFLGLGIQVRVENLLILIPPVVICSLVYFIVDTGLISVAMALAGGLHVVAVWRERCQWLAVHYVVLCILGMCLCIAYSGLGTLGILVFVIPVLMMAYAQMQYLDKADQSLKEVERINKELAAAHHNAAAATTSARRFNQELLLTLAKMIDAREPYMVGHSRRVSEYAVTIAEELSLPSSRVETIRQAALLHDIGKIGVPDGILTKSGKLTADEYKLVMMHVTLGVELLEACPGLSHLVPIIRYHHERWDGRGYPDRIKSDRMPLEARILSLCDAVEAMSAGRPYRRALTMDQIISEVRLGAGGQFDPHLAEVMIRILLHDRMPLGMTSKADDTWARQSADLAQDVEGGSPPGQVWAPQPAASS